ncbi:MAG: 4Fe-4S dicluster-binding protein [Candidatus Kariarchaeaceae archaeon]
MTTEKANVTEWVNQNWGANKLPIGGVVPGGGTSLAYKTGDWRVYIPILKDDKCTGCTHCYFVCPDDAIAMDEQFHPIFKYDYCKGCTLCADVCNPEAIEMILEEK